MVARTARRLPGFRFEVQPSSPREILPRMDVAAFVGFAASGPLHLPVPVEEVAQFTNIFGRDAPLAWDEMRGEQVFAYLAPAVRAFFRNGGRRCWVIRVAAEATSNIFPIPNLAQFTQGKITPAFARARCEGSWSDSVRVGASLLSELLPVVAMQETPGGLLIDLALNSTDSIAKGDLLRLTFRDGQGEQYVLITAVQSVERSGSGISSPLDSTNGPATARIRGSVALWFQPAWRLPPPSNSAQSFAFVGGSEQPAIATLIPVRAASGSPPDGELDWPASAREPLVTLDLSMPFADAPAPGSLLRVNFGDQEFWLAVEEVSAGRDGGSPPEEIVRVKGEGLWWLPEPPASLPASLPIAERLIFELWTRRGNADLARLSNLGFAFGHPRCWDALPTDAQLYGQAQSIFATSPPALWRDSAQPRFPLAGSDVPDAVYFPIALSPLPEPFLGANLPPGTALERDGLVSFDSTLFLDPELIGFQTVGLLAQADFLRYTSPTPRPLRGLHAALGIEEATLISVPDSVHRGWSLTSLGELPPPVPPTPTPSPEWWQFLKCGLTILESPSLSGTDPDSAGTFTLTWQSTLTNARYVLEESTRPDFSGAAVIYAGTENRLVVYGHAQGDYYYRVRAEAQDALSDWSNGIAIRVAPGQAWRLNDSDSYSSNTLVAVQRALLRMCAARGDMLAILSAPEHYREEDLLSYVAGLKSPFAPPIFVADTFIATLGFGEFRGLSFGAIYHPWLIGREDDLSGDLRHTPPDGAATGILARRALARGAWIAPANEPLHGAVALTPHIGRERWLELQAAQVNLIRQEPHGLLALNADTLSDDLDLRLINVRRLLSLLRRLALQRGAAYVFEPNDTSFRRLVQRGFESVLERMFARGAFAGRTPADSFQISVVSTPEDVEQGRFIVELRVAPSVPMTFLTIRLVQSGERGFVTERA